VCADRHIALGVHEFQSLIAALTLTPAMTIAGSQQQRLGCSQM